MQLGHCEYGTGRFKKIAKQMQVLYSRVLFTVYPKKYAHGFVVLCFVVVMQSFIMNSHEVFIHIHQGCFAGTGAMVRLPQCQWSNADGYGKISQCITTTKHNKAKTVCIFLGIYSSPTRNRKIKRLLCLVKNWRFTPQLILLKSNEFAYEHFYVNLLICRKCQKFKTWKYSYLVKLLFSW